MACSLRPPRRGIDVDAGRYARWLRLLGLLAASAAVLAGAPSPANAATTTTIKAAADGEVLAYAPSSNFGGRGLMRADQSPRRLAYLRFANVRVAGAVTSAKLRIYVTDPSVDGPEVSATAPDWSEAGLTFRHKPDRSGRALGDKRAVGRGWAEYDVTAAVAPAATAVGFVLSGTSTDGLTIATREGGRAPELRITTSAPASPARTPADTTPAAASPAAPAAVASAAPSGSSTLATPAAATAAAPSPSPAPSASATPSAPVTPSAPAAPSPPAATGAAFADDFDGAGGSAPDPAKWVDYGPGCGAYAGWGSIRCGAGEHLDGAGHLVVPATAAGGAGLQTKGRFGFVYGTMSAWIKMPAEAGYWPGFWSLNGTQTGAEALTGEIDATEVYTTWSGSNSNVHVWNGGTHLWSIPNVLAGQHVDLSAGFHKYSVNVKPGKVTFFLDDAEVGSVSKGAAGTPWAWGPDVMRPNFLILDLAVGGAGQPAPSAPGAMLVDRVEVTTT